MPGLRGPPEANALASAASREILWLLLQLERAGDWATARGLAQQIDRESRDELPIIPLWQLGDTLRLARSSDRAGQGCG